MKLTDIINILVSYAIFKIYLLSNVQFDLYDSNIGNTRSRVINKETPGFLLEQFDIYLRPNSLESFSNLIAVFDDHSFIFTRIVFSPKLVLQLFFKFFTLLFLLPANHFNSTVARPPGNENNLVDEHNIELRLSQLPTIFSSIILQCDVRLSLLLKM